MEVLIFLGKMANPANGLKLDRYGGLSEMDEEQREVEGLYKIVRKRM